MSTNRVGTLRRCYAWALEPRNVTPTQVWRPVEMLGAVILALLIIRGVCAALGWLFSQPQQAESTQVLGQVSLAWQVLGLPIPANTFVSAMTITLVIACVVTYLTFPRQIHSAIALYLREE